ncbi:helix-turn-helix domain-containing protein [Streptomyces solisilvae]|uniref:AraC-like ligand-binding domain-containing protein n=1 Tax=Streptomyces malaysiensis TaxID=92644 RepID=UPI0036737594
MRFVRTPRLIRQSDPELYHLTLLHTGSVAIEQSGLANVHGPGGMYFIDCSRPFACRMGGRFTGIGLEIPKALIPPLVADLVTRSLTEHQGIGRLLVGFLTQLSACEASYRAQDMTRLETGLRLEGARGDLADPAQRAASIGYIATRWGFTHHASFTRAFHGRYHMTPTDYRHISLDTEDGP